MPVLKNSERKKIPRLNAAGRILSVSAAPGNARVAQNIQDRLLFDRSLMVCPILNPGEVMRTLYSGANGAFPLYNDAGEGYSYERGEYLRATYRWDEEGQTPAQSRQGDERYACCYIWTSSFRVRGTGFWPYGCAMGEIDLFVSPEINK